MAKQPREYVTWLLLAAAVLLIWFNPFKSKKPDLKVMEAQREEMRALTEVSRLEGELHQAWSEVAKTATARDGKPDSAAVQRAQEEYQQTARRLKEQVPNLTVPDVAEWQTYREALVRWVAWNETFARTEVADFARFVSGLPADLSPEQTLEHAQRLLRVVKAYGQEHTVWMEAHKALRKARSERLQPTPEDKGETK